MGKPYSTCLWVQYVLWISYALSLLILYVLGFFINLLSLRWLLIPTTLGVLFVSIFLSVIVVGIFVYQKVARNVETSDSLTFFSALPSMFILAATIAYFFRYL
ncbi:MAG TPA: hypothetical protein DCK99_18975 [Blastocatellia bacterium]|jgi:hypothetical protein|nr:hypothetical protein [Blastocatellia bacterium]